MISDTTEGWRMDLTCRPMAFCSIITRSVLTPPVVEPAQPQTMPAIIITKQGSIGQAALSQIAKPVVEA